jgi:transcriptional regulator with XRE-family HTH domain
MVRLPPELFGFPDKHIAKVCGVSLKTAQRWKAGQSVPPKTALMILARDLGCFAAEWHGWTVNGEDLVSPDGWTINRNDALVVPFMHGQISALRQQVAELQESEHDGLEEQPAPGELPAILAG